MARGDWDAAIADFTRVTQLQPQNPLGHFCRAEAYCGKQDYKASIEDYEAAARLDPTDGATWLNLGLLLEHLGSNAKALEAYKRFIPLAEESGLSERLADVRETVRTLEAEARE